ncbi:MAG: FAD-dependent oxidoreductase [Ignavibacteriae bacterium HGW-Ignavibacteriae-1]|nr:MAG: FAD-dependent oxidoreductase [Ignavibacteriae bacterium HGW-Ignavibacteriae-1]
MNNKRVVIIGAGFGGLELAKSLNKKKIDVTLIDRNNHHLFQPLLYQVASSALSPADIAAPIRSIFRYSPNIKIIMNEAVSIDTYTQTVRLNEGSVSYDYLVLAPGSRHSYFGNNQWEKFAPGLKEITDALKIRENLIESFERAEMSASRHDKQKNLTFVIVGGGPTGVEMAGAIAEIARRTLLPDYPLIAENEIKVILVDASSQLLGAYPDALSDYTKSALENMGVEVRLNTRVSDISENVVTTNNGTIEAANVIWAAGNEASPLIKCLDTQMDKIGRAIVDKYMNIPGNENVFVIGDSAFCTDEDGKEVPGIAPAAMQQAKFVADVILHGKSKHFKYRDKGMMATIGKAKAVSVIGKFHSKGLIAWLIWSFIHIFFLIDFRNRLFVMSEWIWFYLSNNSGARLIVNGKRKSKENLSKSKVEC